MPARLHDYSFKDYLLVEEMSGVKHEYLDGEIYAMAGGPIAHAALTAAVSRSLFEHYRRIPSLQAVVYVWQDRRRIEVRERTSDVWRTTVTEPRGTATITALDCRLDLDAVYSDAGARRMNIRPFRPADMEPVVELWSLCGLLRPWNDPREDIARKLRVQPQLFLVLELDGAVAGTVMAGYEGHRGWINYLAVDPAVRRRGLGRALMMEAERLLRDRGCPKINLQVRADNRDAVAFYQRLGFVQDAVVSLGKRLEPDASS
jgi:ribosomal protein S18 acetylase RimI-like enzyme